MGKGTQLLTELLAKPLSTTELAARETAVRTGGEVEATLDGRLVKPGATATSQEVTRVPRRTWD